MQWTSVRNYEMGVNQANKYIHGLEIASTEYRSIAISLHTI